MIQSEAELKQNLDLMRLMYDSLMHLHARVAPVNFANYQVLAEGPIEEIHKLRHEIEEYLGIAEPAATSVRS